MDLRYIKEKYLEVNLNLQIRKKYTILFYDFLPKDRAFFLIFFLLKKVKNNNSGIYLTSTFGFSCYQ